MPIPLFDIDTPRERLRDRLVRAATSTVDEGRFILGPEVAAFEREFAEYLDVDHVVGVANGTDALTIALRAMGIGPGDDVVVPAFTFYASAESIPPTGARPVFCDIDPETMMITPETVHAALTPATKAVIAVHLFGNVAPVREIEALGVPVLEDTAQAAGSTGPDGRPGSLGTAATFSFFPSKNLGCLGDGGAIATSSEEIAEFARMLRFHGSRDQRRGNSSATTRGSTRSRRHFCACSCPSSTAGRADGAGRRALRTGRSRRACRAADPDARSERGVAPLRHPL